MAGDEDPWGFLPKRTSPPQGDRAGSFPTVPSARDASSGDASSGEGLDELASIGRTAAEPRRERGELRAEMGGPSLKRRGWPLALALALIAFGGYLTEIVASSQLLALAGPGSLVVIFPLGGIGLLALALLQFRFVDHRARLPLIRVVALGYAAAFAIVVALLASSIVPVVATGVAWVLADQLNFLLPLLIWSLASDEFNVAESRRIYPWIVSCTYLGQVLGLGLSAISPWLFGQLDLPLIALLAIPALLCMVVGLWLPRALRGAHGAQGSSRPEGLHEAVGSAWDFISGVPVWRSFLLASVLTFCAGATVYLLFLAEVEDALGSDVDSMQSVLGFSAVAWFVTCWVIQAKVAVPLQNLIGIPGALLILPFTLIAAGLLVGLGALIGSLGVLVAGVTFWVVPRWSVDENARRSALALVPDERRARVSFVVDLLPIALGLVAAGILGLIAFLTGAAAAIALIAALLAAAAIVPARKVRRDWEDSLLNWRLRRRKQNRTLDLG